jgi:Carboxypeptidase regulatory-like domain
VRAAWRAVTAAGLSLALAGCGVETLAVPNPPAVTAPPVTPEPTLPPNLSSVDEGSVAGAVATPSSLPIRPGGAALNGTVLGPSGPVAGATVEADRLVGDQVATTTTTTAADGSWTIGAILGGRYRVRAWQQPGLAVTTPQIFFLGGTELHSLTIQLTAFGGPNVAAGIAPGTPIVDQPANLALQVTEPTVGADGVVRNLPEVGVSVTLTDGPLWQVNNANPLTTGPDGTVLFEVQCQAAGVLPMSVAVGNGAPIPLQLPACASPPPTTTTTTTTTVPSSTTSTTCPSTTTSLPAGRSTPTVSSPAGPC